MADVMVNFSDTQIVHQTQEHALGYVGHDRVGNRWSYVQFREVIGVGDRVRDSVHTDLIATDNPGTVSAAAAIGTDILTDAGKFPVAADLVGCIGAIVGGAGVGQNFRVIEQLANTNELRVIVHTTPTGFNDRDDAGWNVALDATSQYRLFFPGAVRQGDGVNDIVRGFSQVAVAAADLNKYGWVQQTGMGFMKLDASVADVAAIGEGLGSQSDGLVAGWGATITTTELDAEVGRSLLGDYTGSTDVLIWAKLEVDNTMESFRLPHTVHPFAVPGQRIT